MVRGNATTSWWDKTMRGQSNERMRRGDATPSWCDELARGRHNERMTRGYATTSWHNKVTRGWRNKRQHNLVVFRVQMESTDKVAAMVVARIERKLEVWGPGEENEEVGNVVQKGLRARRHLND